MSSSNLEHINYTSNPTSQTTNNRSDVLKRMRSEFIKQDYNNIPTSTKVPKTKYSDMQESSALLSLSTGSKMLSFSNPGSETPKNNGFGHTTGFPDYSYALNSGVNAPVVDGGVGPLTASQWIELQNQALVYKYIQANLTVPSGLLLGLKRSGSQYLFKGLHSGSYSFTPNSLGWGGSFHLGLSGNSKDPEPGRCRRTDGKKWRCARDAVPEHKYCERHLSRGRHRSRKLVEGLPGQVVTGKGQTAATNSVSATSASGVTSRSLVLPAQQQIKDLQPNAAQNNSDHMKFNRVADHQGMSVVNHVISSKSKDSIFYIPKQCVTTEDPSRSDFGLVSSDSLLNPWTKTSYMNNTTSLNPILPFNENSGQYPLRHFMGEERPKGHSDRAKWPEEPKQDWTQLSMAIPMSSDFSSTSSSSPGEKMMLSPLKLSHELDPNQREMNWGSSMGGPLGEVLLRNTNSSNAGAAKNLANGLWFRSSPTGVLQKTTFGSLSNSSCGSSPRGDTKKMDGYSEPSDNIFGSHLKSSVFFPPL